MRIVFMGTPAFAVPMLEKLVTSDHEVVGVITATDKIGGRGRKQILESDVKKYALKHGLKVLQPKNLKSQKFVDTLRALKADLQVVVAFRMLPVVVWDMPPLGTINLHASLLPKYRGAAPINWAVINGETKTGLTTFKLKHEIDTGNIIFQEEIDIGPDETAGMIHDKMMPIGAELVLKTVEAIDRKEVSFISQENDGVTHAPKIFHEDCKIDLALGKHDTHNFIRGLNPYPTAWMSFDDQKLKLFKSSIPDADPDIQKGDTGKLTSIDQRLFLHCHDGPLELHEVQMPGKIRMSASDFINGNIKQNV